MHPFTYLEEVGLRHQDSLEVKGADPQQPVQVHLSAHCFAHGGHCVDRSDAPQHLCLVLFPFHQVHLVQDDAVRKCQLLHRLRAKSESLAQAGSPVARHDMVASGVENADLILNALWLLVIQMLKDVLGVNHCDNGVQPEPAGEIACRVEVW